MAGGRYVHRFDIDDRHTVHIYQGSLAEVRADALVSSDDNYLSAGGGVSAALARVAGEDVRRERLRVAQESRLRLGQVVRTSGGGLPCRHLYHAITIEDFSAVIREKDLRMLVTNLLGRATEDGVKTLAMPALGTGVARFDMKRASAIIIEELVTRLVHTPIEQVILALVGDEAERLFYEELVRAHAPRCAASLLRQFEQEPARAAPEPPAAESLRGPHAEQMAGETGEQFPSLIDATRLAVLPQDRPRLVAGLTALILRHADAEDIDRELLSRPECARFRGSRQQKLMDFLYLGEKQLRLALGPALFRLRDLRGMAEELGETNLLVHEQDQLIDLILRALCFNVTAPPAGITQYLNHVEQLLLDLEAPDSTDTLRAASMLEAAKIVERVLKDLLRLYGWQLFGPGFEAEFVRRKIMEARRDGGVSKLTLGKARDALRQLENLAGKDQALRARLNTPAQQKKVALLPGLFAAGPGTQSMDCRRWLDDFIPKRNDTMHDRPSTTSAPDQFAVHEQLEHLRTFLLACRAEGIYPEVLRYEGTYENRDGERFLYFVNELNKEIKVRSDEKIDPRRHYYCFTTNNPVYLFPVLVPKL